MKSLLALINELETKLPFIEQKKESLSQVSIGWHLEHSLLPLIKMISAVEHSNPSDYKKKIQPETIYCFNAGKNSERQG